MPLPIDTNGNPIAVGTTVRILSLSGQWVDDLPAEERSDVMSMVGEVFIVEAIDEFGYPWVRKSWSNMIEGRCHSHSIALEQHEMMAVQYAS